MISLEELFVGLRSQAILTDEEIQHLRTDGLDCADAQAVSQVANQLVAAGKLTRYQSSLLLDGRWAQLSLGEYLLLDKIGEGGMGEVCLALHRRMQRRVALKLLHTNLAASDESKARFCREIRALAQLSHPNIVTAYDAGEDKGVLYLVMEYVDGETLHEVIRRRGPLPLAEAVGYILQVARGLQVAHTRGIVHRDIKPANLLCNRTGTVKILDLGLARLTQPLEDTDQRDDTGALTQCDRILGTIDYMAPEQATAGSKVDHRADIYSLGCCLYYLLVGRPLYPRNAVTDCLLAHREAAIPSLLDARPDLPGFLDTVVQRMVAKHPDERFSSVDEVLESLALWGPESGEEEPGADTAESGSVVVPFVPPVVTPGLPPRVVRKRWPLLAAAGIAAVLVGLLAVLAWVGGDWWASAQQAGTHSAGLEHMSPPVIELRGHADGSTSIAGRTVAGVEERPAAEWVFRTGGTLEVRIGEDKRSVPSLEALPSEPFRVVVVSLGYCAISDRDLVILGSFPFLEEAILWNTPITDDGLACLTQLEHLRSLYVNGTAVHGPGLSTLTQLTSLELMDTPIADEDLAHLKPLRTLEVLYIDNTAISDDGVDSLCQLTSLKELHVERTRLTSEGIARLRAALPACRIFHVP